MSTKQILWSVALSIAFLPVADAQKVAMVGDSHIALHTYPDTLKEILAQEMPCIEFESFGIGGAGFYTFVDKEHNMQHIYDMEPEVLIVALGTNDCNNWYYTSDKLRKRATRLYEGVKEHYPDCRVVFITPFFFKTKEVRGRKLEINPNVENAANTLAGLATSLPDVWTINLVPEHGMEFLNNDLMKKDFIHLTNDGYRRLARIVADSLEQQSDLFDCSPITPTISQ